jgi:hypothetical protein
MVPPPATMALLADGAAKTVFCIVFTLMIGRDAAVAAAYKNIKK